MSKHKRKRGQKPKSHRARPRSAPPLPTAEEVVGAIVSSLAAPLLEDSGEAASARSGVHAILPRGEEHRAHPRAVVTVAVGLETESHFFAGLSGDVSEGGVFVQTYRDLPVGCAVEIVFDLPDGQLEAHGRVRWHRDQTDSSPAGVGIAFEALQESDRRIIQRFCEHRAPLYYDVG